MTRRSGFSLALIGLHFNKFPRVAALCLIHWYDVVNGDDDARRPKILPSKESAREWIPFPTRVAHSGAHDSRRHNLSKASFT